MNQQNLRFVPVGEEQAELLFRMIEQMAAYEKEEDEVFTTPEKIRNTICNGRYARAVIAYLGEEAAAYAIYYFTYSSYLGKPTLYIEDVFVEPACRGTGLGGRMMAHLAGLAVEAGCERMDWTCLAWNQSAIEFYSHIGGEHQRERLYFRAQGEALQALARKGEA